MFFTTLLYHEIREAGDFNPDHQSHIDISQDYDDILPPVLFTTSTNFESQMEYLYKNNYHTLTLEEVKDFFYTGKSIPEKSVLLTFDDCYQSIKLYAYPILKKYNFHAVSFVVKGWLHSSSKQFNPSMSVTMCKEDLLSMSDVFEYANHTDQMHTRVGDTNSAIMVDLDQSFEKDLDSCNTLEFITGRDTFAYPFGVFCDRNIDLLKKKGFKLAFTSESGSNTKDTDPFLLNRDVVPYFVELSDFKKILGNN